MFCLRRHFANKNNQIFKMFILLLHIINLNISSMNIKIYKHWKNNLLVRNIGNKCLFNSFKHPGFCTDLCSCLSVHLSVRNSINLSIHVSGHLSVPICSHVFPFVCDHQFACSSVSLLCCISNLLPPSVCPFVSPSVHPSVCLYILLSASPVGLSKGLPV